MRRGWSADDLAVGATPGRCMAGRARRRRARLRRPRAGLLIGLVWAAVLTIGGGVVEAGPEVVRVRVPAKDVTKFFPPGTELRVLSPREFESRVEAASAEPAKGGATAAPRLIRARHRARWDSGLLRGRSELVVGTGRPGRSEFPLEPWTPAILVQAGAAPAVGARDSGGAVLRVAAVAPRAGRASSTGSSSRGRTRAAAGSPWACPPMRYDRAGAGAAAGMDRPPASGASAAGRCRPTDPSLEPLGDRRGGRPVRPRAPRRARPRQGRRRGGCLDERHDRGGPPPHGRSRPAR